MTKENWITCKMSHWMSKRQPISIISHLKVGRGVAIASTGHAWSATHFLVCPPVTSALCPMWDIFSSRWVKPRQVKKGVWQNFCNEKVTNNTQLHIIMSVIYKYSCLLYRLPLMRRPSSISGEGGDSDKEESCTQLTDIMPVKPPFFFSCCSLIWVSRHSSSPDQKFALIIWWISTLWWTKIYIIHVTHFSLKSTHGLVCPPVTSALCPMWDIFSSREQA